MVVHYIKNWGRGGEERRSLMTQTQMTYQQGVNAGGVIYTRFEPKVDFPMSGGLKKACEKVQ